MALERRGRRLSAKKLRQDHPLILPYFLPRPSRGLAHPSAVFSVVALGLEFEDQAGLDLGRVALHLVRLEAPLSERRLDRGLLLGKGADDMDMLHRAVGADDDANGNLEKARTGRCRLDPMDDIRGARIVMDADRRC